MTSKRRGQRASWLTYAAILVHHDRISKVEALLRQVPVRDLSPPGWKERTWARIEAEIAAGRLPR